MGRGKQSKILSELSSKPVSELEEIVLHVQKIIERKKDAQREQAILELKLAAEQMGFDLFELVSSQGDRASTKRATKKEEYFHPEDPSLTWSGRGRRPKWFRDLIKKGIIPPRKIK